MKNIRKARVLLALDILTAITVSQSIQPQIGKIFNHDLTEEILASQRENAGASAQNFLQCRIDAKKECKVCAKGAFLMAHVLRFNRVNIDGLAALSSNTLAHELPEFGQKMMAELETLFEGVLFDWNYDFISDKEYSVLKAYHNQNLRALSPKDRLIQILALLLMNSGRKFVLHR